VADKQKPEGGSVTSIMHRIQANTKLVCVECGHRVADMDGWDIALDTIGQEPTDSGTHMCPKCRTLQDHTVLSDGIVFTDENLIIMIPTKIWLDYEADEGFYFSMKTCIDTSFDKAYFDQFGRKYEPAGTKK